MWKMLAAGLVLGALGGWSVGAPSEEDLNESAGSLCAELGGRWQVDTADPEWMYCDI